MLWLISIVCEDRCVAAAHTCELWLTSVVFEDSGVAAAGVCV